MYSMVLMMAMSGGAAESPQFLREAGCSGRPQTTVRTTIRAAISSVKRPHILRKLFGHSCSSSCAGVSASVTVPAQYSRMPDAGGGVTVLAAAKTFAPVRTALLRAELNHAINTQAAAGTLTYADATNAHVVMSNAEMRGALLAKVAGRLQGTQAAGGNHPFLEFLLANFPQILQDIKDIIALFGK